MNWNVLPTIEVEDFFSDVLRKMAGPLIDQIQKLRADQAALDQRERDPAVDPGAASEAPSGLPPAAESNAARFLELLGVELQLRRDLVLFFDLRHIEVRQAVAHAAEADRRARAEMVDAQATRRRELAATDRFAMLTRSESSAAANRNAIDGLRIQIEQLQREQTSYRIDQLRGAQATSRSE